MTARTTMADLILQLRGMTNAGTADYTIGTASYWSDDHLQTVLDQWRLDVFEEPLQMIEQTDSGGTVYWKDYRSSYRYFEQTDGGTAIFYLQDTAGALQGTANWTPDYNRGIVLFGSDTGGTTYLLTGRSYDLYAAAADVWEQKGSYHAQQFDWSSDNHSVRRGSVVTQCQKMADKYRSMSQRASAFISTLYRSDTRSAREE